MAEKVTTSDMETSSGRSAETFLRVVPMGLCLAALVLMIKNSESTEYGDASYSNFLGFRFLVYVNGIGAAYSLLSAFFTARPGSHPMTCQSTWAVFLLDQVLTYLILSAAAVSAEMVYLADQGDISVTWSQACEGFPGFCHRATATVVITFAAVVCFMALSVLSSYRLFSSYDPPVSPLDVSGKGGIEAAARPAFS